MGMAVHKPLFIKEPMGGGVRFSVKKSLPNTNIVPQKNSIGNAFIGWQRARFFRTELIKHDA